MPGIDYNAILSPNGAASGFAELASTIARIPQIRRQQKLDEIKAQLEQRRMVQADQNSASLARYHDAMAGAAGTRAGAYADNVGSQVENRGTRTAGQVEHWKAMDTQGEARVGQGQQRLEQGGARLALEGAHLVPTETRSSQPDSFGAQHTVYSPTGVTPEQRLDQGAALALRARGAMPYGQAMSGPPQAAPPMQAPAPAQAAPPLQTPTTGAPGDPITEALRRAHPADQAAYQRILATGDPARIQAAQQRLLGAAGAPP